MKQNLFKTLLLAATLLVGGANCAWAETADVVETYDFENWGKSHMYRANNSDINGYATMGTTSAGFSVNGSAMNQLNITSNKDAAVWDLSSRFAVSSNVSYRWGKGSTDVPRLGNENQSGIRYISIIDLNEGDRVVLTCSNVTFFSSNATYDDSGTPTAVTQGSSVVSGTTYTITGEGTQRLDLQIASKTWGSITNVSVTRNVEIEDIKTWNFKTASWSKESGFNETTIKIHSYDCNYATGALEGLALQGGSGTSWTVNGNGMTNGNGNRDVVILDLQARDIVEVITTTTLSALYNGTSKNSNYTGTCTFDVTSDGTFGFTTTKNGFITSITVYRETVPLFPDGSYYLKNKDNGAYFGAGQSWSTQAITSSIGHIVTLHFSSGKYSINTEIYNGDLHYLNGLWCDGTSVDWKFTSDGEGYYTISDGTNNLTAGTVGAVLSLDAGTADNAKWQLLTEAEWKAEQVERLDAATASNGVDATFYIPAANFNRNDNTENNKWQGSPAISGFSDNNAATNYNAEKFNTAAFDVYQELTGLKPGAYKLTAQGFYRNGTTNDRNAILYANSFETPLVSIRTSGATEADTDKGLGTNNNGIYVPDGQSDAAKAFNAGLYNNELYFVVGEGGTLRVGVKKTVEATNDWAVFDNFQLTYYGTTITGTIPSSGLGSLASAYGLDFSSATVSEGELTAYVVNEITVDKAKVTPVNEMPANSGVILEGTPGATYSIPVKADAAFAGTNYLQAAVTATDVAVNQAYILQGGLFHLVTAASTVPAGKAYLLAKDVPAEAKALSFDFGDADGINTVQGSGFKVQDSEIFNLAGQRMNRLQKGVNIVNGKKVLVK